MKAYGLSDVGMKRSINQDYIYYTTKSIGNVSDLFVLADGMGGHKAGDVASRSTVEMVVEYIKKSSEKRPVILMDNCIKLANEKILDIACKDVDFYGMGTTLVMAIIESGVAYISNVGDSRLYLINSSIKQITRDHSLVEEMISLGELDRNDAKTYDKKNVITRAIGGDKKVVPDFFEVDLEPGDRLLICSDGLTNMITDSEIKRIVFRNNTIEEGVKTLIDIANQKGGDDNISVILIQV